MNRQAGYEELLRDLNALCAGETDHVTIMATIACELFHRFDHIHWAGFYRNVGGDMLKIGPYQGGHGCLAIPFARGVCGRCARERRIINVPDVESFPGHIACSAATRSEIVAPMLAGDGRLLYILDLDSDAPAAFDALDEHYLPEFNRYFL